MAFPRIYLLCLLSLLHGILSEQLKYNWDIGWISANPDGRLERPVVGVNGKWPCPPIHATVGDRIQVTIHNRLGNESTSIHWHGIQQKGTNAMDGPPGVTQCPLLPGDSFTYDFEVDDPKSS